MILLFRNLFHMKLTRGKRLVETTKAIAIAVNRTNRTEASRRITTLKQRLVEP